VVSHDVLSFQCVHVYLTETRSVNVKSDET